MYQPTCAHSWVLCVIILRRTNNDLRAEQRKHEETPETESSATVSRELLSAPIAFRSADWLTAEILGVSMQTHWEWRSERVWLTDRKQQSHNTCSRGGQSPPRPPCPSGRCVQPSRRSPTLLTYEPCNTRQTEQHARHTCLLRDLKHKTSQVSIISREHTFKYTLCPQRNADKPEVMSSRAPGFCYAIYKHQNRQHRNLEA